MIPGLVSVIIPTKDRPNYLRQAVESVLAQTYPHIELIIIDDGSADEGTATEQALNPYLSLPHLTYLYHENQGIGATVNRGLTIAQGEYLQRLDDDDRLLPEKVARCVDLFEARPSVGLVATGYHIIDPLGKRTHTLPPRPCPNPARLLNMLVGCISAQAAVIVRACVHQKVGVYRTNLMGEDYQMWIRIAKDFDIATIDEPLVEYRRHPGNTTCDENQIPLERDMMHFIVEYLKSLPLDVLVPNLSSPPHALALRAAIYLLRDRQAIRTTDLAKADLGRALQMSPDDPLLSLWKGVLAVHGDENLQPLPWNTLTPGLDLDKTQVLADFYFEHRRLMATQIPPNAPKMVAFRRRFSRFRSALITETFRKAIGKERE